MERNTVEKIILLEMRHKKGKQRWSGIKGVGVAHDFNKT